MSRFAHITETTGNDALQGLYREITQSGFGREIPYNWFTSQSTRPDILAGTWSLTRNLMLQGELPPIVKQMIVVTISVRNNCNYCKCVHGHVLSALGVDEHIINSCISDPELKAVQQPHKTILEFALKVSATPAAITAADFQLLQDRGVNQQEILEIIALSAYCNFINTWADLSQITVDPIENSEFN